MAENQHFDRWFGVTKGATWGTVVDVATAGGILHTNQPGDSWQIGGGITRAPEFSKNNNIRKFHDQRHDATFNVSYHYDFNGLASGMLIGAFMGSSTDSPSENTSSQGDYAHAMPLSAATTKFLTVAGVLETDEAIEGESAQPTSLTISGAQNDPLRVDVSGVVSKVVSSYEATPENTKAELAGMTYPTPDLAFCNGTNLYCRINASGGGALSSSDDIKIMSFSYQVARSPYISWVFDGAGTSVMQQPRYPSPFSTYQLSLTLDRLDESILDIMSYFQSGTELKAELLVDGEQIGSGDNASIKISVPKMVAISNPLPSSSHASQMNPTIVFTCMEADSAPTGMTGITLGQIDLVSTQDGDLA